MALIYYPPMILANPETGLPIVGLKGAAGHVVPRGTTTPVAEIFEDQAGSAVIPGSALTVTENMFVRGFYVDDALGRVSFYGGGIEVPLTSEEGNAARIEELSGAVADASGAAAASEAAAESSAADAEASRVAAEAAAAGAVTGISGAPTTWPTTFPPIIGTGSNQAMPGNKTFDDRYYTRSQMDAILDDFEPSGGDGGTIDTMPSLLRRETSPGVYPARGTARTDLQVVWVGTVPPAVATPSSGTNFVTESKAMSYGSGQGPDRYDVMGG